MIKPRYDRKRQAGTTIVIITVFMVALFAFAALSLDVGNVLREQRKTHTATDAAAFAGVVALTNSPQSAAEVMALAGALAGTNGVTATEISQSTIGAIQVGIWTNKQFLANTTTAGGYYNAVRVPARRTVPLYFGRVVGLGTMRPQVDSVAMIDSLSVATGLRPWGVTSNSLIGLSVGSEFTVSQKQGQNGQWGILQFNYDTEGEWNTPQWHSFMVNGYPAGVDLANPRAVRTSTGSEHLAKVLDDLSKSHEIILIPVVRHFNVQGKEFVPVVGFIGVSVVSRKGGGSNMEVRLKIERTVGSGQGGGPGGPLWLQGRFMVQ